MIHRHTKALLLAATLAVALFGYSAIGQESILSYALSPEKAEIAPGGRATLQLSIENKSLHPADDIAVSLIGADGFTIEPAEGDIKVIAPFGKDTFYLNLIASSNVALGTHDLKLQVIYTYCIEVSCFQIVDEVSVPVLVSAASVGPTTVKRVRSLPSWVIPMVAGILLITAILLWRFAGIRTPLYAVLSLFVVGGLAYGVILGQHEQAQGIAAVLCTSCVGIEESQHEEPVLSEGALSALNNLNVDLELIVYYAPWCHTCPYAEAMVEQMAQHSDHIKYRFVNVDENRDMAAANGIIHNQRTVVPAIQRVDSGDVIFGIDHLEERLLDLLGVEK